MSELSDIVNLICEKGKPRPEVTGDITRYKIGLRSVGAKGVEIKEMLFGEYKGMFKISGYCWGTDFDNFEYYI